MIKLWCYSFYWDEIKQMDFEERAKSYKFVNRPSGFNSIVLKDNVNKAVGDFVFAESREKLIEVILEKLNKDILLYQERIKGIEKKKELVKAGGK